jgi:small GTP-binding protein
MDHVKVVFVGNAGTGKTSAFLAYTTPDDLPETVPGVAPTSITTIPFTPRPIHLHLWDTSGKDEHRQIRSLRYPMTDAFIICFSIVDPASFDAVQTLWAPEVKDHCPKAACILAGMKSDLRGSSDQALPSELGEQMKTMIGAKAYIECSAVNRRNIRGLIIEAIRATGNRRPVNISYEPDEYEYEEDAVEAPK